ncbi:cysteine and histidine-rich domain-containing protein 1-like [Corticium candelabrum]|uniref:cysteine and histidine-rich domain-containing protein 1-like n=1 Tax=Corticium candelabrum TaxID=121492 RepID=UPI002E255F7E|nr:cysteine and histidine-rich domain-containing protein 1-like [Corticium candelabrum]
MATESGCLRCYNKGCGKDYREEDNHEKACRFHPGEPFFHDAYKGWNCCNKKSTDFTEFLNVPGCKVSYHSNIKPPEPEKPKQEETLAQGEVLHGGSPQQPMNKPIEVEERPSDDLPMVTMKPVVDRRLTAALNHFKSQLQQSQHISTQSRIPICTNRGCGKYGEGGEMNTQCHYHPGVPIFHEGMKFWSCCQRKTSDFNQFLQQEPCSKGEHNWADAEEAAKLTTPCRYDFFQTSNTVVISIFAKNSMPEETIVAGNPTTIKVHVVYDFGRREVDYFWKLHGVVDPRKSSVTLLSTKVEIKLKKASASNWPALEWKEER